MAKRKASSFSAARLKKAVNAAKNKETSYGQVDLPAGINNGIAKITDCKMGKYKKGDNEGEYFWMASGIVHTPDSVEGVKVKGLRTSKIIGLCDTEYNTFEEQVDRVLNECRKLGVDTSDLEIESPEDFEDLCEAVKETASAFRFSTVARKGSNGKTYTNEFWNGNQGLEDWDEDEDGDDGVEADDDDDADEEEAKAPPKKARRSKVTKKPAKSKGPDLDALGTAADADDDDAQEKLEELAESKGLDPDEYDSWTDLAQAIGGGTDEDKGTEEDSKDEEGSEEDEYEEIEPAKEEMYYYLPKGADEKVEVEVTRVVKSKKTVSLKNLEDGKTTYRSVPWSELSMDAD